MRTIQHLLPVTLVLLLTAVQAEVLAVPLTIGYQVTSFGGGRYRFDYEVTNNSLPGPVREFTIWFDDAHYRNLALATPNPPAGNWNELIVQPAPSLHEDGFYDALAKNEGVAVGARMAGFAVEFDWLDAGLPGSQPFDVIDPTTFQTQYSGFTVPEPAAMVLLAVGLVLAFRRRYHGGYAHGTQLFKDHVAVRRHVADHCCRKAG